MIRNIYAEENMLTYTSDQQRCFKLPPQLYPEKVAGAEEFNKAWEMDI